MSLPLHGQQGIQRSFVAALRFKSSTSLQQCVATEANTSANCSASTSAHDTSEETSLYDPAEVDPFKHVPSPPSSSFEVFYDAGTSDNSSLCASPMRPSPTSSTQSLSGAMEAFNGSAPPSPETLSLKQKTVLEHNEIQRKIRRMFELVMSGGHHLKETVTLTKDIESHFIQAPGVITDSECCSEESAYTSSTRATPEMNYSDTGYPFPIMPSPQSSKSLGLINEDDETLVSESPTSTFEANDTPPMTPIPVEASKKPSRIPRFRLSPLLIVKTPSLASISAYTLSPTPTQTSFRRTPLTRSFSAPMLFAKRDRSSPLTPALASPTEKAAHSAKARMSYIPKRKEIVSDLPSPKIRVKFDFEPPDDMTPSPTKSRFSASSSFIPIPVRDRWYKPRFNFGYPVKGWRSYTRPKKLSPSCSESFTQPLPPVSEHVQPTPGSSPDDENQARRKPSQNERSKKGAIPDIRLSVTVPGRWPTDWDGLFARIGNDADNGEDSESAIVLRSTKSVDSLNAAESPQATALLFPIGATQVRRMYSFCARPRSNRRLGMFLGEGSSKIPSLPTKPTPRIPPNSRPHDTSFFELSTPLAPIKKPVECQVQLPGILSSLDDMVDSKGSKGVVRMLSMASRLPQISALGPKGRAQRISLMLPAPSLLCSTASLPRGRSPSGSRLGLHNTARSTHESGIGDILGHFPNPPLMNRPRTFLD